MGCNRCAKPEEILSPEELESYNRITAISKATGKSFLEVYEEEKDKD